MINLAIERRNDDFELTDIRYHPIMGLYCRFGHWPIALYIADWWGGLYMCEMKNTEPTPVGQRGGYFNANRIPVGFEILPGKRVSHQELANKMQMPVKLVQEAYETILIQGQGTCASAWSTK